jgi:hypothetical protein
MALMFLESLKFHYYFIYIVPFYTALLAIWAHDFWQRRWAIAGAVCCLAAVQMTVVVTDSGRIPTGPRTSRSFHISKRMEIGISPFLGWRNSAMGWDIGAPSRTTWLLDTSLTNEYRRVLRTSAYVAYAAR